MTNPDNDFSGVPIEDIRGKTPDFYVPTPRGSAKPSAREVLVDLAMDRATSKAARSKLANRKVRSMIVQVPDQSWADPVAAVVDGFVEHTVYRIARSKPSKGEDSMLSQRLGMGWQIVGVSPDPERCLPDLLLSIADLRIKVEPPDVDLVMQTIKLCLRGPLPVPPPNLAVGLLTYDEITSSIIPGTTAAEALARLQEVVAIKQDRTSLRTKRLPDLEEAKEYGAARDWALNLRDDLADVGKGLIGFDQVDKGAVLFGPPGTGKTLLAEMLGKACGIPTVVSSVAEFFASSSGHLDGVIKAQRKVFADARAKAPCILFLDEINAYPNVDGLDSKNRDYWMPVVLDFYQLLDGVEMKRDGVIVVGATNRIEDVNPAILRPGRLERSIFVGPPDRDGLKRILRHHLDTDLAGENLDLPAQLNEGSNATGADLMMQVRSARRAARRAGRKMIMSDLVEQISPPDARSESQRLRAAVHEAGHVVVGLHTNTGTLEWVSLMGRKGAGGAAAFLHKVTPFAVRSDYDGRILMMLAGRAAEEIVLGEPSQGSGGGPDSDLAHATEMIAKVIGSYGLGDLLGYRGSPNEVAKTLPDDPDLRLRVEEELQRYYAEALDLLAAQREQLDLLTAELLKRRFLTAEEVHSLLDSSRCVAA